MTIILPFFYFYALVLPIITLITWYFNSNKCILTQTEKYIFDETIIECYYKFINVDKKTGFIVPEYQRNYVFWIFVIQILYHCIINSTNLISFIIITFFN